MLFGRHDLNYIFPYITDIRSILCLIKDKPNFYIKEYNNYKIIDYDCDDTEEFKDIKTYTTTIYRELKGIAFDKTDRICSRPYHKFYNFKETSGTSTFDISSEHKVYPKLSGTMVRPLYLTDKNGKYWRLASRDGIDITAMKAEEFIQYNKEYLDFINKCDTLSHTPIFEYLTTDSTNKVKYDEEKLVLVAIRNTFTGKYMPLPDIKGVDVIQPLKVKAVKDLNAFAAAVRCEEGIEGYVISSDITGHKIKILTDWFTAMPKLDDKNILKAIMEGTLDEFIKSLPIKDKNKVIKFNNDVMDGFKKTFKDLVYKFDEIYYSRDVNDRQEFTVKVNKLNTQYSQYLQYLYSIHEKQIYSYKEVDELKVFMSNTLYRQLDKSDERFNKFRWIIGEAKFINSEEPNKEVA